MFKKIFSFYFLFCIVLVSCSGKFLDNASNKELSQAQDIWKLLPIQHQGRVKPFDTFSREILRKVYGKEAYKSRSAVEVILSWLLVPDFWENTEFILIEEKDIKQFLDLPLRSKRFSPSELKNNQKLALQFSELQSLRQRKESLDSYFQNFEKLEIRWILYEAVKTGQLLRIEPQGQNGTWFSLSEMTPAVKEQFERLLSGYIRLISANVSFSLPDEPKTAVPQKSPENQNKASAKSQTLVNNKEDYKIQTRSAKESVSSSAFLKDKDSFTEENTKLTGKEMLHSGVLLAEFKKEMQAFRNLVFKESTFHSAKIKVEVFYNSFKPFQKAWIFYVLFLVALIGLYILKRLDLFFWIMPLAVLGFVSHSLGMALRSYIMSRPPVSNMYETVVWVPWVALIAGFVFYLKGTKLPFIAGVLLASFCLLLTSLAPEILDGSLQPLEAVLNSSFWLTTHVLIITMSYSFFFLAFVLGDMALVSFLVNKYQPFALVKKMFNPIYRSIQWGVVFLAGGTILGGIWADYSWGRFWGWDPKESWALVSLLAYLALLHGRLVQWIKPFGMVVGSVMMFFSVIMAWYGVNFILGAGLHSYGFGTGGVEYVLGFLIIHLILCGLALFKKGQLEKKRVLA